MAQTQIAGEIVTHVCTKNAGEAERGPVSRSQRRKVYLLHGVHFLTRCLIAIEAALRFSSERIRRNRLRIGDIVWTQTFLEGNL